MRSFTVNSDSLSGGVCQAIYFCIHKILWWTNHGLFDRMKVQSAICDMLYNIAVGIPKYHRIAYNYKTIEAKETQYLVCEKKLKLDIVFF